MQYSNRDKEYLDKILELKIHKNYTCKKCGSKEFYFRKVSNAIICKTKHCNYEEGVTANTAFHGLRIPISVAMDILEGIQKNYKLFRQEISKGFSIEELNELDYLFDGEKNIHFKARLSLDKLSVKYKIEKNSIDSFLKRIGNWMPKKYSLKSEAEPEWYSGLKNNESKKVYTALFNLLFDDWQPRDEDDILYILVKKRIKAVVSHKLFVPFQNQIPSLTPPFR